MHHRAVVTLTGLETTPSNLRILMNFARKVLSLNEREGYNDLERTTPVLPCSELSQLRLREWEVLIHMANDLSNEEISLEMSITLKSVENYHTRIADKLHKKGKGKLSRFARSQREALLYWGYMAIRSHQHLST